VGAPVHPEKPTIVAEAKNQNIHVSQVVLAIESQGAVT
jgi:hypothetical protein